MLERSNPQLVALQSGLHDIHVLNMDLIHLPRSILGFTKEILTLLRRLKGPLFLIRIFILLDFEIDQVTIILTSFDDNTVTRATFHPGLIFIRFPSRWFGIPGRNNASSLTVR